MLLRVSRMCRTAARVSSLKSALSLGIGKRGISLAPSAALISCALIISRVPALRPATLLLGIGKAEHESHLKRAKGVLSTKPAIPFPQHTHTFFPLSGLPPQGGAFPCLLRCASHAQKRIAG